MNYSESLNSATEVLRKAKRILVLTGAGVSAESGIPTFRGGGGTNVWKGMPFDQLSSARLVEDDLPLLWDWFDYRRTRISNCDPNDAHFTLAKASRKRRFKSLTVVTQNIDGLHQAADNEDVIELHGSIWRARCLSCGRTASVRVISQDERPPVCRECLDHMRPDVVLFGEALPAANFFRATEAAEKCDVCLVIGTSAQVYPAAGIPHRAAASGATVIEINPEDTELTLSADISIKGKAAKVLPELFAFIDEPFEQAEHIEDLEVEIRLDQIRLEDEPVSAPVAEIPVEETEEAPSLGFLLNEEFESNRELIFEVAYAKASAMMYKFASDDEQPFFFVCGTGLAADGETVMEWEPELVASVKEGIKTIAGGDQIFYTEGLYINPAYKDEIKECLLNVRSGLPEADLRKIELFQRPSVDEWIAQTEERMRAFDALEAKEAEAEKAIADPQEEGEEPLSERHFLLFWRDTSVTAHERAGKPLEVVSSNQIIGASRGDTLWIATLDKGELVLCGRMQVGEVVDRFLAEERFGKDDVWKSDWFAVALDEENCENLNRIHLGEQAYELRFNEDEDDRFIPVEGRISRKQTRKMRELTSGSVDLLEEIWSTMSSSEVGDDELKPPVFTFDSGMDAEPGPVEIDDAKLKLFAGCLVGGAVGDALGAAIEFDSIRRIREKFGEEGLKDFSTAYGRLGAITDDTQMTLFTAEGLLRARTRQAHKGICYPARIIYNSYLRWLQTQGRLIEGEDVTSSVYEMPSWLRDIPEMNALRAPGNTCLSALASGKMGTLEERINDSKGCGGVMRVAPIGLIALNPFQLGAETAAITHGHPSGFLSAGALALIINRIVQGSSLLDAVEHAIYEELPKHEGHQETFAACDKAINLAKSHLGLATESNEETESSVCDSISDDEDQNPRPKIQNSLPSSEIVESIGAGWIAEEALAIAIYCSLVHELDFTMALLLSVNHSGDSDSTGAITGNILGALHGIDAIPRHWLERLELRETIEEISRDLLIGFRTGTGWWNRYPGI